MTLYEMTENIKAIYDALYQNNMTDDGEQRLTDEQINQIIEDNMMGMGFYDKVENYCIVINQAKAEEKMLDDEIKRLQKRKDACKNIQSRCRQSLLNAFEVNDMKSAKTVHFTVSTRETESVKITDEEVLPSDCYKITRTADKTAIKNRLKNGMEVIGAQLVTNKSLTIR